MVTIDWGLFEKSKSVKMFYWVSNYPESFILFLIAFFCLLQAWWLKKDFFSPANVYCFTQTLSLGVAYLQLDKMMTPFHLKTWLFWGGALLSFLMGASLLKLLYKSKASIPSFDKVEAQYQYNWSLHVLLSFIPFIFFLIGIYGIIQKAGTLLVFTDNPSKWMTKEISYGYFAIMFSSGPLVVLSFGLAIFKRFNPYFTPRLIARIMVPMVIALNLMAYPNRTSLFMNLGFLLILSNYLRKKISSALILLVIIIAASFFMALGMIRSQYASDSVESMAIETAVELPYKYIANNYWNFDYAINPSVDRDFHPFTYGVDFFHGPFEYFKVGGAFRSSYGWDSPFNESIMKEKGYNTVSYLWEIYKDLGAFGVFILPFFASFLLYFLFYKIQNPLSPKVIMFYTLLIYFVAWWWFSPAYKNGMHWFWFLFIFWITSVCKRKSPVKELSSFVVKD